jgi:hypothetical protein
MSNYLTQQFDDPNFNYPYAQALRGEVNSAHCGIFIPQSQIEKANWRKPIVPKELIEYAYNSGQTEVGLLLTQPRMVITPISELGAFDRTASQKEGRLVAIGGGWQREYKQDENIGNFQIYLIILLDDTNQPLHDVPLRLVTKGAFQATLSEQWQKSCTQIAKLRARASQIAYRPQNRIFNALCVFIPHIERRLVGNKTKSPACYVSGYLEANANNWLEFFLGSDQHLADWTIETLNPTLELTTATQYILETSSLGGLGAVNTLPTAIDTPPAIDIEARTVEMLDDQIPF